MHTPTSSPLARLLPAFLLATSLAAQEKRLPPIQDNSFLVEEAYNQETGVVQHISTFTRFQESKDWIYTFTRSGRSSARSTSSASPCPGSGWAPPSTASRPSGTWP